MANRTCSEPDCDRNLYCRGLCNPHYQSRRRSGALGKSYASGENHPQWTGGSATYAAVHQRLRSVRGPAKTKKCGQCGAPAREWSYDHSDPDQLVDDSCGPYSLDLARYRPLCARCHRNLDVPPRVASRTTCRRGIHPFPESRTYSGAARQARCGPCAKEKAARSTR
jgi:hypothetical protein